MYRKRSPRLKTFGVVVVCCNASRYAEECVKSIFSQTIQPEHVLVLDNNSEDNSVEVLRGLQGKYDFELIERKDNSLTKALNEGIRSLETDYVSFISADDLMTHNRFELQQRYLQTYPDTDVLYGNMILIDEDTKPLKPFIRKKVVGESLVHLEQVIFERIALYSPTALFKKSIFLEKCPYNEGLMLEDFFMNIKVLLEGRKVRTFSHYCAYYRVHGENFHKRHVFMMEQKLKTLDLFSHNPWYKKAKEFVYLEHFCNFCSTGKLRALKLILNFSFESFFSLYFIVGVGRLVFDWRSYLKNR